ncbi:MAG: tetratricopeptide repeat protein, partial [Burkholderiales bacterium]
ADARAAYQQALEKSDAASPYRRLIEVKLDALGETK